MLPRVSIYKGINNFPLTCFNPTPTPAIEWLWGPPCNPGKTASFIGFSKLYIISTTIKTNLGPKNANNNPWVPSPYIKSCIMTDFCSLNIIRKLYQIFENVEMVKRLQKIYWTTAYNQENLPPFLTNFNPMFHFYSP